MPRATDSSTPPSSGWIPATFKSSDLQLAAVASLRSAELSISNDGFPTLFNESLQATVSQPFADLITTFSSLSALSVLSALCSG